MKQESNNHRIDPELEARIVALILGEASEEEQSKLESLILERPELAVFKHEIESAHGLMMHVGSGEWPEKVSDWKLSPEKRDTVLAVIRGESSRQVDLANNVATLPFPIKDTTRWNLLRIAAAVCGAGIFGLLAMMTLLFSRSARVAQSSVNKQFGIASSSPERFERALKETSVSEDREGWMYREMQVESQSEAASARADYSLGVLMKKADPRPALRGREDLLEKTVDSPRRVVVLQDGRAVQDLSRTLNDGESVDLQLNQRQEDFISAADESIRVHTPNTSGAETESAMDADEIRVQRSLETKSMLERPAAPPALGLLFQDPAPDPIAANSQAMRDARPSSEAKDTEVAGMAIDAKGGDFGSHQDGVVDSLRIDPVTPRFAPLNEVEFDLGIIDQNGRANDKLKTGARTQDPQGVIADSGIVRSVLGADPLSGKLGTASTLPSQVAEKVAELADTSKLNRGLSREKKESLGEKPLSKLGAAVVPWFGRSSGAAELPVAEIDAETLSRKFSSIAPGKSLALSVGLGEVITANERFSTFSLHVSDVSFKLAQAALARSEWPEAATVRIEEFVNAFDYSDPMPSDSEKVACRIEQSIHPFVQQRNLLRVSMRTATAGRAASTPLRITFLLDNSGSMERIDRRQTVRRAFAMLAQQLAPNDQVTLICFARQPRLLADKVSGAQSSQLVQQIDSLPSEGGTNIEAALQLAFEKASEQQLDGAQNRIVLLTDGAVNLGDANPERLSEMVTSIRNAGIAFDAAGISAEGLNDEVLESLTRKGDGRYYLLDSAEDADEGFAKQIAGALRPSAKNVKVQVEFNPKRVRLYKLLGFEKHRLNQEDFRNDRVDAAEMAAEEAGVAVYQFESMPDGEGDVGSVSVRFRDLSTGEMIENRWPIPYEADAQRCEEAASSMRIATVAAMFAAKLRGEPLGESVDLTTLSELLAGLPEQDRNAKRVQAIQTMINQAQQLSGKP